MGSLDDLPKIDTNHDIEEKAEFEFAAAVNSRQLFMVQRKDRRDNGTDVHLEARDHSRATNLRVQVQLKGTAKAPNADGSVSVSVDRTNLNYLLRQRNSLYVCYHIPSKRLLFKFVEDVYHDYERHELDWQNQAHITIRFHSLFDAALQERWHAKVLADGKRDLRHRLDWSTTPPEKIQALIATQVPAVEVPTDPERATAMLKALYENGQDHVISVSFDQFAAVLDKNAGAMDLAYMAEINIGMNSKGCDHDRVRAAVDIFQACLGRGSVYPGSVHYCIGNAWLALREYEKAKDAYLIALPMLGDQSLQGYAAQCLVNMGAALGGLGNFDAERAYYERALELDPDLGEAHFGLGLWYRSHSEDAHLALSHLDRVAKRRGAGFAMPAVWGWRVELLFRSGDSLAAFREIQVLLDVADDQPWVWPWCARQVAAYGRTSPQSTGSALTFWKRYLRANPGDVFVQREIFFCQSLLHATHAGASATWENMAALAHHLVENGDIEAALIWDRLGHWAQDEGNWANAQMAYRRSYELEPDRYGYCLGTALNFLRRFEEALPILESQATKHQPDAKSWFQVARAREGTGDIESAIKAYEHAVDLDPDYELAWFNLGGLYWNRKNTVQAVAIWKHAISRFPNHEVSAMLRAKIPMFFEE